MKTLKLRMKFFVSGMKSRMNFDKDHVFISAQLIPFPAVQKVYDQISSKSKGFQNSNEERETKIMSM